MDPEQHAPDPVGRLSRACVAPLGGPLHNIEITRAEEGVVAPEVAREHHPPMVDLDHDAVAVEHRRRRRDGIPRGVVRPLGGACVRPVASRALLLSSGAGGTPSHFTDPERQAQLPRGDAKRLEHAVFVGYVEVRAGQRSALWIGAKHARPKPANRSARVVDPVLAERSAIRPRPARALQERSKSPAVAVMGPVEPEPIGPPGVAGVAEHTDDARIDRLDRPCPSSRGPSDHTQGVDRVSVRSVLYAHGGPKRFSRRRPSLGRPQRVPI